MDSEADGITVLIPQELPVVQYTVDDVESSQNPLNEEYDSKPFVSQSQSFSQAGPSTQPPQLAVETDSLTESFSESQTSKKRRGRPTRESISNIRPTRESQRPKRCPKVLNYESFKVKKSEWTERDKQLFLTGCLKLGIEDIDGLRKYLPHKSEWAIRNQMAYWKHLAKKRIEARLKTDLECYGVKTENIRNLDEWINHFKEQAQSSNVTTLGMQDVFSIIAEYGKFPSPEACGGVNFRAIYRYLHCMMNGIPPYGLDRMTCTALLNCIDSVMENQDSSSVVENLEEYLFNPPKKPENWNKRFGKTYKRKEPASSKPIKRIVNNPILNPLNLPVEALVKDVYVDSEDDED